MASTPARSPARSCAGRDGSDGNNSQTMKTKTFLSLFALASATVLAHAAPPAPLLHAHAHNDYEHKRPLLDALDHGFCSVEADIFLVDGKLLVAHELGKTKPERTLQALYLDPLRELVKANGGRVKGRARVHAAHRTEIAM